MVMLADDYIMDYVVCFIQGSGIKVTSLKVILASWLQRCSVNKLQVECNRFLECYKRQKDITISQKWCILGTVTIEQLDRFLDHVLDRFLYELRSDLVIYCPANPLGLRAKTDLAIEVTQCCHYFNHAAQLSW